MLAEDTVELRRLERQQREDELLLFAEVTDDVEPEVARESAPPRCGEPRRIRPRRRGARAPARAYGDGRARAARARGAASRRCLPTLVHASETRVWRDAASARRQPRGDRAARLPRLPAGRDRDGRGRRARRPRLAARALGGRDWSRSRPTSIRASTCARRERRAPTRSIPATASSPRAPTSPRRCSPRASSGSARRRPRCARAATSSRRRRRPARRACRCCRAASRRRSASRCS